MQKISTSPALRVLSLMLLGILALSSSAMGGVSLQLPENIFPIAVNGKKVTRDRVGILPDGLNQVAVRYKGLLGDNPNTRYDKKTIQYSDVFVLKFDASNQALSLSMPKVRTSYELERFDKNPDFEIVNEQGQFMEVSIDRLSYKGLQLGRDYESELLALNASDSPAAVKPEKYAPIEIEEPPQTATSTSVQNRQPAVARQPVGANTPILQPQIQATQMAEKMLKYWYKQADENARKRFKDWQKSQ